MNLRRTSFLLIALVAVLAASPMLAARLVLSGADFHTVDGTGQYFEDASAAIVGHGGIDGTCLVAGVDLPAGAIVQNMRVRYLDAEPLFDFSIDLERKRRGNSAAASIMTFFDTNVSAPGVREQDGSPVTLATIDDLYVYYLSTDFNCLDSALHRILAVTIDYVVPSIFADGFESGDTTAWGTTPTPSSLGRKLVSGPQLRGLYDPSGLVDPVLGTFEPVDVGFPEGPYLRCGIAPVQLPDGVMVTGLIANVYDSRTDRGLTLSLRRKRMNLDLTPQVLATDSTSASTGWQILIDLSASSLIDNNVFWYYLDFCITGGETWNLGDLQIQAVQIDYTLP